ncbi:MAG: damage-inducible protein DinB [Rhodobacteraceae bacterium]|nr:damage-inducible protein DinB [Paracoccaceae bacterium]
MVTADYVRLMARYNAWQNASLAQAVAGLDAAERARDRGAFFGSITRTMSHLLWADLVWMSRFEGGPRPEAGIADSPDLFPDAPETLARRVETDRRIRAWAEGLKDSDLGGNLRWMSGALGRETVKPFGFTVMHMFNHQTHHRGQIHAMLTAAGARPGDTDLFILPDTLD